MTYVGNLITINLGNEKMKKKILIITLVLVCIGFSFAANTNTSVVLSSQVNAGHGVITPDKDTPSLGGGSFFFYFRTSGINSIGENNTITLADGTPYSGGTVDLIAFYNGNEGIGNDSTVGKHRLTIEASPWKRQVAAEDLVNVNPISAKVVASPTQEITVTGTTLTDTPSASLDVTVVSTSLINDMKVGTYTFTWPEKELAAGDYIATLTVSVGAI